MGRFSIKKIGASFRKKSKNSTDVVDEPQKPTNVDIEEDAHTETDKSSDSINIDQLVMQEESSPETPDAYELDGGGFDESCVPIPPAEESPAPVDSYDALSPYDEGKQTEEKNVSEKSKPKQITEIQQKESEIESLTLCQDLCFDDDAEQQKRGTNAEYPDDEVCDGVCACFDEHEIKSNNNDISDENDSGIACDGWNFLQNSDEKEKLRYKTADDENTETGLFCSWF